MAVTAWSEVLAKCVWDPLAFTPLRMEEVKMSKRYPINHYSGSMKWQRLAADTVLTLSITLTVVMILAPFAGNM